jgi:N-methylhydantoinase A
MAAARGIIDIVNENMFGALRMISVQQGYDPRDFALMGFGGAGPLHVNAVARLMGSWPAISPVSPACSARWAMPPPACAPKPRARSAAVCHADAGRDVLALLDDMAAQTRAELTGRRHARRR